MQYVFCIINDVAEVGVNPNAVHTSVAIQHEKKYFFLSNLQIF